MNNHFLVEGVKIPIPPGSKFEKFFQTNFCLQIHHYSPKEVAAMVEWEAPISGSEQLYYLFFPNETEVKAKIKFSSSGLKRFAFTSVTDELTDIVRRKLLAGGWEEETEQVLERKRIPLMWIFLTPEGLYQKEYYEVRSMLKNFLDTKKKEVFTNKAKLTERFPSTLLAPTVTTPEKNKVYIFKPTETKYAQGKGIEIVDSVEAFQAAKRRFASIPHLISEYISDVELFEGRKFHLRIFFGLDSEGKWSVAPIGRLYLARLPYQKEDWTNREIHDTHAASTGEELFYPDDYDFPGLKEKIEAIFSEVAKLPSYPLSVSESQYGFEWFGADLLVTEEKELVLLEVNAKPNTSPIPNNMKNPKRYWEFAERLTDWIFTLIDFSLFESTYTRSGNAGLEHEQLASEMEELGYQEISDGEAKREGHVGMVWMETTGKKGYDNEMYKVTSYLKNLTLSSIITDKSKLYFESLKKYGEEAIDRYLMPTWNLEEIKQLKRGEVLILRPVGKGFFSGKDIFVVSNDRELTEAKRNYSRMKFPPSTVIASEYLQKPTLFLKRKFHLRMYLLITDEGAWSLCPVGEIFTAAKPYVNERWYDKAIHDTHAGSTKEELLFPYDYNRNGLFEAMEAIAGKVAALEIPKCPEESLYSYEVFGMDFLLDSNGDPILLEVNGKLGYSPITYDPKKNFSRFSSRYFSWLTNEVFLKYL